MPWGQARQCPPRLQLAHLKNERWSLENARHGNMVFSPHPLGQVPRVPRDCTLIPSMHSPERYRISTSNQNRRYFTRDMASSGPREQHRLLHLTAHPA